jgi:hypothetical protein
MGIVYLYEQRKRDFVKKSLRFKKCWTWRQLPFGIITEFVISESKHNSGSEASKYVWGIGFHWYESWSGGDQCLKMLGKYRNVS